MASWLFVSMISFAQLFVGGVAGDIGKSAPPDAEKTPAAKSIVSEDSRQSDGPDDGTEPAEDAAESDEDEGVMSASVFSGLKLRGIGPALTSGRIGDFAVHPEKSEHYYVAVASGGVWKTVNGGTTFKPIFDEQGSFSIGCVTLAPDNPHVVWVGTGENNSQRSVAFGDGVYRSLDGGAHWENMGLKDSEHIGMIAIDPSDSEIVYVASQGPLWRGGGDRGLYKTIDGGKTWDRVLHISDDTGVNEVHLDPRDSRVLYASSYQRRRHVFSLVNGGPESAVYKSTDAGESWRKIKHGLPSVDLGRVGLDVSPANPDVLYAIVEAADGKGGLYRSTNRGESWEKRCGYKTTSAQYYNEVVCDPCDVDRVYLLDTVTKVSEDGGKTFKALPREFRHVDDHALWIDPNNTGHLLIGGDGGIYESYERGENWRYMPNLPVTQFYRGSADNSLPFYFVYGGTQDNQTLGGPSRTLNRAGITNEDWFITLGGDGFKTQVDPEDPNIVYSQLQYGNLVRFDRRSGERIDIKPRELPGDDPYRWNWDSPLIISPHSHTRLYFAANRLFRSDDRGNSWRAVSGDLTRQIDRNTLEMMGTIHSAEAPDKNRHTSPFGNIVSLSESPLVEGLIYVGTDDGLIQVTEDGGESWRKIGLFPGVPDMTYVGHLIASQHDPDTVYAAFNNHKQGDFKPYLLKSTDRGQEWTSVAGDLPERHFVYVVVEDHVKADLLFVGTEFGAFFSVDGGKQWTKLKGGIATISIRDIDIQERENDLVLASFGRGFYILDDYSVLRHVCEKSLDRDAIVFPVRKALRYIEKNRLGGSSGRGSQGASFYAAANPPFGAVFTYYIKEKLTSRKERRLESEKKIRDAGGQVRHPSYEELLVEDEERPPTVILTIRDAAGEVVRRIAGSRDKGIHRASWDLRYPSANPTSLSVPKNKPAWWRPPSSMLALPGEYSVTLSKEVDGIVTQLTEPQPFEVVSLDLATLAAEDKETVLAFRQKANRLHRAVQGSLRVASEVQNRVKHLRKAVLDTTEVDVALLAEIEEIDDSLNGLLIELRGNRTNRKREHPDVPSISERVSWMVYSQWNTTSAPTQTQMDAYNIAGEQFASVLAELRTLLTVDLPGLEKRLEEANAPWTPGRIPDWTME